MRKGEGAQGVIYKSKLAKIRSEYDMETRILGKPTSYTANQVMIAQNDLIILWLEANNRILQQIRNEEKS